MDFPAIQYQVSRRLSRFVVRAAALVTLHRMPPFVSAAAIIVQDGKVLMIKDPAQSMRVLPGGHLHWGESVEEGLRREVFEETGYRVQPDELLATYSGPGAPTDRGIVRIIMRAHIVGGNEQSSAEGEVVWPSVSTARSDRSRDAQIVAQWANGHSGE
jgi:ADP-ribose pyrophosphatase YjhB (NUDIX family)